MDYSNQQIEAFKQFADQTLKTHQIELRTRYQNESIDSVTLQKAREEHSKMMRQQLDEEIDRQLAGAENPWLRVELNKISKAHLEQLSMNVS